MKIDKNRKEEYKIARSKERVKMRNLWKQSRRSLQGCKMLVLAEEIEARERLGKKPITPKKWKEERNAKIHEAQQLSANSNNIPKDFYCDELKERRKAKKECKKALILKVKEAILTNVVKHELNQKNTEAIKHVIMLTSKLNKTIARRQSKEDKAKYKASLVEFKIKYVCTHKVGNTNNPVKGTNRHKKNRGFARKSIAKIYSIRQTKQAA